MLGGAVFEVPQPIFSDPSDFKVTYTPPSPTGATLAIGATAFNQTALQMLTLTLPPCGVLAAHTHPRGTEYDYVISGNYEFGFFLENGTHLTVEYAAGDGVVVPQGAVHYTRNAGCTNAQIFVVFDDPDPATIYVAQALASLPPLYLDSAFSCGSDFNVSSNPIFQLSNCTCSS